MRRQDIIETINATPAGRIASLAFVQEKFIQNYNACNPDKQGELMYHRQMVHFNQIIAGSQKLQNSDRFSLYACFVTAAANGYSLDPADNTVYLVPKGGKAVLWRQAGAHVHRLIRTNQISRAEQVQLVYKGDVFKVMKSTVLEHIQNFGSNEIIAAYQEFILPDGKSRYFIYRQSNWDEWRLKSDVPDGENWNWKGSGQPREGFLKTKITKHACMEKVWATGMNPIVPDSFQDVEIETDDDLSDTVDTPTGPVASSSIPTSHAPIRNPIALRPVQEDPETFTDPGKSFRPSGTSPITDPEDDKF